MLKGVSFTPKLYVLKSEADLPEDQRTKIKLRALKMSERADIKNNSVATEVNSLGPKDERKGIALIKNGDVERLALQYGLVSLEPFEIEGKQVSISEALPADKRAEYLEHLPREIVGELANEITKMSELSKEEQKN